MPLRGAEPNQPTDVESAYLPNEDERRIFPIVRQLHITGEPSVPGLLAQALDISGIEAEPLPQLNGYPYRNPSVTIIGVQEMRKAPPHTLPGHLFVRDLDLYTGTSQQAIIAHPDKCGLFGYRGNSPTIALTFDPDTTEILRKERTASGEILWGEPPHRRYPHLSLGQVALSSSTDIARLKGAVNELAQDIETLTLLPVRHTRNFM